MYVKPYLAPQGIGQKEKLKILLCELRASTYNDKIKKIEK